MEGFGPSIVVVLTRLAESRASGGATTSGGELGVDGMGTIQ